MSRVYKQTGISDNLEIIQQNKTTMISLPVQLDKHSPSNFRHSVLERPTN